MGMIKTTSGELPEHEKKQRAKRGEGVKRVSKGGKSRGKRKLTDQQVLEIVARVKAGEKAAHLAKAYGVSHPSVSAILNGRTYVWLTGIGREPVAAPAAEEVKELEAA